MLLSFIVSEYIEAWRNCFVQSYTDHVYWERRDLNLGTQITLTVLLTSTQTYLSAVWTYLVHAI